jgi:peptidoglycan/LPS O-acetylase OafA/YrhL
MSEERAGAGSRSMSYIPTLDGWRAIAITAVFFAHIQPLPLPGRLGQMLSLFLWENGSRGVGVFFAISGLLICSRLLDEEDRNGHISLRNFYIRRAFRILPPALFFLVVLAVLRWFGLIDVSSIDWFSSLFFFRNYTVKLSGPPLSWWFTSHFWSLSIEEHFYLILPALLIFLPRWRGRALVGLAFLSTLWKLWVKLFAKLDDETFAIWMNYHTEATIDALLIPASIAVYIHGTAGKRQVERLLQSRVWLALLVPLGILLFIRFPIWPMAKLAVPLLILCTVLNPNSLTGRFLESSPLRWIGRLSYSLYLWQMLFLCTRFPVSPPLAHIEVFPWNAPCLLACACFSYYLIERPLIRLGHHLTRSSYPARELLAVPGNFA